MSELPNFLFLYLQRIVFDVETMMNKKLSDRFEFPNKLNVEPYTKEGVKIREENKKR